MVPLTNFDITTNSVNILQLGLVPLHCPEPIIIDKDQPLESISLEPASPLEPLAIDAMMDFVDSENGLNLASLFIART
jgi:hypothetical protein